MPPAADPAKLPGVYECRGQAPTATRIKRGGASDRRACGSASLAQRPLARVRRDADAWRTPARRPGRLRQPRLRHLRPAPAATAPVRCRRGLSLAPRGLRSLGRLATAHRVQGLQQSARNPHGIEALLEGEAGHGDALGHLGCSRRLNRGRSAQISTICTGKPRFCQPCLDHEAQRRIAREGRRSKASVRRKFLLRPL